MQRRALVLALFVLAGCGPVSTVTSHRGGIVLDLGSDEDHVIEAAAEATEHCAQYGRPARLARTIHAAEDGSISAYFSCW